MSLHEMLQKTDAFILSEVCCLPGLHALTKQIAMWERIMWQRIEGGLWSRARGISLAVQWLRLSLQCRGYGFDPWWRS